MAFSTQRAVSDGTLILLGVSIGYIKQADIGVFYNGLPAGAETWSWVGTTTNIAFSPAVPAGVEVLLARTTQIDKIINRFTAGAGFTNQSMDTDFQQVLYLNQEAVEGSALTDVFSDVDFHGYRLKNIGTATQPTDAVSLQQYQADALGASAFKNAAAVSAAAALTSQNAALVSQNAAVVSQNASAASALTSGNSASASGTSASNSDASRVAAVAAQAAAIIARTGAETALDSFDDRYLGSKSTDPTLDNDGNALLVGALYWNTSIPALRVWNGTAPWITFPSVTAGGISNTPAGSIAATTVQAAINELDLEKAKLGANSDITSLAGLTTALTVAQGGTGGATPGAARSSLGAAASGANNDITSLSVLTTALSIAQGGTGRTTDPGYTTPAAVLEQFNAAGSAPVFACRAWVNLNGTGTIAIRGSGNVSSVTDNGPGDYTVNFATAMQDANYSVLGGHGRIGRLLTGNGADDSTPPNWTAGSCRVAATTAVANPSFSDFTHLTLSIFR